MLLHERLWRDITNVAGEIGHVAVARGGRRCLCRQRGYIGRSRPLGILVIWIETKDS